MTAILARPLVAPAATRIAPNTLIALGAITVGLTTALLAVAHSFLPVLLLRALAGFGDAFFYVLASAAVYALAPEADHASAQSRLSAAVNAGLLIGPIAAETLRPFIGYTGVWLFGAGLCGAALVAAAPLPLPHESPSERRTVLERRVVPAGVVLVAQTWALSAFTIFVALYATHIGLANADAPFAILALVVLLTRSVGACVFDHFQPLTLVAAATLSATAGLTLLALVADQSALLAGSLFVAVGQALGFPALLQLAIDHAGPARRTAAVATFTGFFEVGLATAAIGLGAILNRFGFGGLYTVGAAISAAALVPLLLTRSS